VTGRPATYWRPGDEPGERKFALLDNGGEGFTLEGGGTLEEVTVAYETWGTLNPSRSNAVLVLHALTGDSHAAGVAGPGHPTPGWWDGIVGARRALDTDRYFVVCPNVLGGCQGTTGPSSLARDGRPFGSRFPVITIRDQVSVEVALADFLGIDVWYAAVGGSMGGMRALEWAVGHPSRLSRAVVIAVGAAGTADQIALCSLQVRAIRADHRFSGGDYYEERCAPLDGLSIARGIGQFSYRTWTEFESRFGREPQDDHDVLERGRYAIESYLNYQGEKLAARFDPNSYIVLSEAMNHHDVGRARGGVVSALKGVRAQVTVAGITSDRLYPRELQDELARLIPRVGRAKVITSAAGHDGFLLETDQVGEILRNALGTPAVVRSTSSDRARGVDGSLPRA
jgi:homoserine O-acetyltransferase